MLTLSKPEKADKLPELLSATGGIGEMSGLFLAEVFSGTVLVRTVSAMTPNQS